MFNIYEKIESPIDIQRHYVNRDGFIFTSSINGCADVFDAIVIRHPAQVDCSSPKVGFSSHNLEEHFKIICDYKIKSALVIAQDIKFLPKFQELESLEIIPAKTANDGFDYSPLYEMLNIKKLDCSTSYGTTEKLSTTIDYSNFKNLIELRVEDKGHLNYQCLKNLKVLSMCRQSDLNFSEFHLPNLKSLTLLQCSTKTLDGLEHFSRLQELNLWYMRKLFDISALSSLSHTLRSLSIENASKINSFDCLNDLINLEYLRLSGNNELDSVSFLQDMEKLILFYNTMPIIDGDISACLNVPYASVKCKKNYNLKDKDLPKNRPGKFILL